MSSTYSDIEMGVTSNTHQTISSSHNVVDEATIKNRNQYIEFFLDRCDKTESSVHFHGFSLTRLKIKFNEFTPQFDETMVDILKLNSETLTELKLKRRKEDPVVSVPKAFLLLLPKLNNLTVLSLTGLAVRLNHKYR